MTLIFRRREQKHIFQKSTIVFWNQLLRKSLGQCETEVHNGNNIWPENLVSCYNLLWQLPLFNRAHLFFRHLFPCYLCYFITVWYFVTVPLIYIPCQCYTVLQHVCVIQFIAQGGLLLIWVTVLLRHYVIPYYCTRNILCQWNIMSACSDQLCSNTIRFIAQVRGVPISS